MVLQGSENGRQQDRQDEEQPASNARAPAVLAISTFRNWEAGHIQKGAKRLRKNS
jgi:hypothetical protein